MDKGTTYSKMLIWAVVLRFAVTALFFDALGPLLPQIATSFSLSDNLFQMILGLSFIIFAIGQLASVLFIATIGLYRSIFVSCLYVSVAVLIICLVRNSALFVIIFISIFAINSIGSNATRIALRNLTSDVGFKQIFSYANAAVDVKQAMMPFIAGTISSLYGWRWAIVSLVIPVALVGIWIELIGKRSTTEECRSRESFGFSAWKAIMYNKNFLLPTLTAAAFQLAFVPIGNRLPFILMNGVGVPAWVAGLILSIDSAMMAVSFLISGYLVSRMTNRQLITIGIAVMIIGLVIICSGSFLSVYAIIPGILLSQFAFGFIVTPCTGAALNVSVEERPLASAIFGFIQPIISGLAVLISGLIGFTHLASVIALVSISISMMLMLRFFDTRISREMNPSANHIRP